VSTIVQHDDLELDEDVFDEGTGRSHNMSLESFYICQKCGKKIISDEQLIHRDYGCITVCNHPEPILPKIDYAPIGIAACI
jgi:hypothetical protein